jgi:hypothetical protein
MTDRGQPDEAAREIRAIVRAAREVRAPVAVFQEWIEWRLVRPPSVDWDEASAERARRVRRLTTLGLNLEGVEVALQMRERLREMRAEVERLELELRRMRRDHEREIARLMRDLADQ